MEELYISRLFWVVVVLGGISLFVLAFAVQIKYLLSNPKSVNVEVIYEKSLPFPAVTICNENRYRYFNKKASKGEWALIQI